MAHPDKDSGTEEEDWFMENFVKTATWRGQRSLATWVILRPLNRARVLLNQNPFQERAAGKWCKGRLPRNFSRTTRATSGGTRAIGDESRDFLTIFNVQTYSYAL